jgi:AraC-like DNA-binding protein
MSLSSRELASGPGWRVRDVICRAGPRDPVFEERHAGFSIALVREGSFQYRSSAGRALLAPGALLLGSPGQCFECGHTHAVGDRCLSFQYGPDVFEQIVADTPGVRRTELAAAALPPLAALDALLAEAEVAAEAADAAALEEIALRLGGAVATVLADAPRVASAPQARDERRITQAVRRIERSACEDLSLATLADEAAMSPYHFLRVFRQVVGMSPHQFTLRTRLQRAALRLARTTDPVATIALECGFGDVSTFNRRFRRVMGANPLAFRARYAKPAHLGPHL